MQFIELIKSRRFQGLLIFLFAFALYANTIPNGYVLDDQVVITKNQYTKEGLDGIHKILVHDSSSGYDSEEDEELIKGGSYHPLSLITYAIEYEYFGLNAHVSHAVNVFLYALGSLFLLGFFRHVFRFRLPEPYNAFIPLLATLIFVLHPVHTEVVASIRERDELLGFMFSVLAANVLLRGATYNIGYKIVLMPVVMALFLLALISKEDSLVFIMIYPLLLYFFAPQGSNLGLIFSASSSPEQKKAGILGALEIIGLVIPLSVVSYGYLFIRSFFSRVDFADICNDILLNPYANATIVQKISTILYTFVKYIQLLIIPHPLTHDYSFNDIALKDWYHPVTILAAILLFGGFVYTLLRFHKRDLWAFAFIYFTLTIGINTNLFEAFHTYTVMSEEFLFLPSLVFALVMANVLHHIFERFLGSYLLDERFKVRNGLMILAALFILYGPRTIVRNTAWKDNYTLLSNDVNYSSNSCKLREALGKESLRLAMMEKDEVRKQKLLRDASTHLKKSVDIYPNYLNAWRLRGDTEVELKNYAEAEEHYNRALEINPKDPETLLNRANAQIAKGDYRTSIKYYIEMLKAGVDKKGMSNAFYGIGESYERLSRLDSAITAYNTSLAMDSMNSSVYNRLGIVTELKRGSMQIAINYFKKALEIDDKNPIYYRNMGDALHRKGDHKGALEYMKKALTLDPSSADFYLDIAKVYETTGDASSAEASLKKAYELNPTLKKSID